MSDTETLFEIEGLTRHFERSSMFSRETAVVRAVDGVSLSLKRGRTLGLVGESGCGKSTLIRTMLRLESLTSGAIRYRGEDVLAWSPQQMLAFRRRVQMVFQDPYASLNPRMTVAELIAEGWRVHPDMVPKAARRDRVMELLDQVGLRRDFADRHPHSMSGGQRQRVGIARALALEPEVLICDEPVSALDVSVQAQVMNLLKDLQQRLNLTLLFVSHNLSVIRHISDDIAVMYLGKIVETGPADQLFAHPDHPYTMALMSASPRLHGEMPERITLLGDPPDPAKAITGCRFNARCWKAEARCRAELPELAACETPRHFAACHFPGR